MTEASITPQSAAATAESPLAQWLVDRITFYDQVDAAAITLDTPLAELGLDSIYSLTLCGDIEDAYGLAIDPTFLADFASLRELADGLSARIPAS
ncbi:acyl carrier protein [Microbacterium allomyrinae]|uniref:Acyl carrier protein n=1 Tax=Microbacterium allomyrinae TaxID=2830666 RepID=A0A9X1LY55_9MICO|nr:acyl carrier protein [Microbacterium allomyrinae]MCC2034022.1 acyl carrier protein [Microbacterium allomyrinae]